MPNWFSCSLIFLSAYFLNVLYITVFYHRGLTHRAITLKPWTYKLVIYTGNWITGLDPKAWGCMHRLHHLHSDTPLDPHSPIQQGIPGLFLGQLYSYNQVLRGLLKEMEPYTSLVRDLNFPVNWLNRHKLWLIPYLFHALLALLTGALFHSWSMGLSYWAGMMSHPIQGWMVNAFGHSFGYRNFETPDHSKNNTIVAWLVMGEGYQNNHHHRPQSPKFSVKWYEVDFGYLLCRISKALHLIEIS